MKIECKNDKNEFLRNFSYSNYQKFEHNLILECQVSSCPKVNFNFSCSPFSPSIHINTYKSNIVVTGVKKIHILIFVLLPIFLIAIAFLIFVKCKLCVRNYLFVKFYVVNRFGIFIIIWVSENRINAKSWTIDQSD